jgi:carboxyl-terminal processing protease
MSLKGKLSLLSVSAFIALYAVVGNLISTPAQQTVNDPGAQMRIFASVLQHIENDYVDEPNWDKVRLGALKGLPYGLDPYSAYLTADQVAEFNSGASKKSVGIGAEFSQVAGYLYVVSVISESPADKAGLRGGDVIEFVEKKATRDISLYDAKQLVMGDAGTQVQLRVLRRGAKPQTITVTRGAYKFPPVDVRIESGRIGVLKVHSLEEGESTEIKSQIAALTKQGIKKLVLDLRGVAAGTLAEGVATANIFVKEGKIAQVIGREGKTLETFNADPSKNIYSGELAVLIDSTTAGAAEVVAAAVMDNKVGEVIGERSFGAGTEQQLFTMKRGDGLLLTVRKWAAPNGNPFLGGEKGETGLKPTIEVKNPDSADGDIEDVIDQGDNPEPPAGVEQKPESKKQSEDIQLKRALEILRTSTPKAAGKAAGNR